HRSAYIGTRHFAGVRTHLGLHLGASIWQFVYPRAYEDYVLAHSQKFAVPAEFIWSIMKAETNYRPDAISPVGAKGLMQVMTHTGRKVASLMGTEIQGEDLLKPHVSVKIGSRYLKRVLKKFKGKVPLAAAAYNGGPHRVHKWLSQFGHLEMDEFIEHIPFLETRNYVKKVVRYYTVYNLLYNKDADASSWLADLVDVHLEGSPPTRETWEVL
ncbi:MAG: lytic transglycosylase domain-containing protein, partial [Bdellovibrionales bacterium]|nr:lytic transglycosylase domain-containing protein [Bdellovibrionales bacterium]NQZ19259.1 lytic transglycosylase domain-containing protein [Bdellovibrionales bacterium]